MCIQPDDPHTAQAIDGSSVVSRSNARESRGLKLGALAFDVPFFQASLSGYSDHAMRKLARRFGCPFAMADMMLAKSVAHPKILAKGLFHPGDDEHPVGAQILGEIPETMAKAAHALEGIGYDLIDLNFACPAPKVLRRGRGGALLDDPDTVIDILKAVQDVVTCPVLMKLRIGREHKPECLDHFWEIVTRAVEQRVNALVIHGRTVSEKYCSKADWNILAEVKRRFPAATIVGSGDIFDPPATVDLLRQTGLDGFVVARGAVGNPWIFRDLRCVWEGRPVPPPPDLAEQRSVMLDHLDWTLRGYTDYLGIGHFRKFAVGYARHHPQRKQVLLTLLKAKTRIQVEAAIDAWYGT